MELQVLAALLASRESYEKIKIYIDLSAFGRHFVHLHKLIVQYYARDNEATRVDRNVFLPLLAASFKNDKHYGEFEAMVDRAYAETPSLPNIEQVIIGAKVAELQNKLAAAFANHETASTIPLLEQYNAAAKAVTLDDLAQSEIEVFENVQLDELLDRDFNEANRLKIYPMSLNKRLDGGLLGGHHLTIFARPEAGKTATATTMEAGFCRQGKPGIYIGNEDRSPDLYLRLMSSLTGMTKADIFSNRRQAQDRAEEAGIRNSTIIGMSPGSFPEIERAIEKYAPRWLILDQMRNVKVKSENRTQQLEQVATECRNLAKKYDISVISVTQAGDSGQNKEVLDQGDVDSSNTGIPAQADVLLGIGCSENLSKEGLRMFSLCKNKVSGNHDAFPVRINPFISRMTSITD